MLQTENSEANGLGIPLPQGKVRLYQADSSGELQFIGEDSIEHTPKDEVLRLHVGNAFDIRGEVTTLGSREITKDTKDVTRQVIIRNHKEEAITVVVTEKIWGTWELLEAKEEYRIPDANTPGIYRLHRARGRKALYLSDPPLSHPRENFKAPQRRRLEVFLSLALS